MALNAAHNERLECPDLLLQNLVRSVHFILDVSVFKQSVFCLVSGLNHLHSRVKAIIRHGAKIKHHLIYSQESFATFDIWLEKCLADHSLGIKLQESRMKILTFYYDWAFIKNEELFRGFIDCLNALSTRDFDYLAAIPPSKNSNIAPPGFKLNVFEMPLNGNSVVSDPDGDCLEATFLPKKKSNSGSPLQIPIRTLNSAVINSPGIVDEILQTSNVPEFSYALEASPVNGSDFSGIKTESVRSSNSDSRLKITDATGNGVTKSFLESGGLIQPPALGNFPLPQKGQSLSSFLNSLSNTMPELDRENAHFNVSEALISAFERLKVKEKTDKLIEKKRIAATEAMFESPYDHTRRKKHFRSRSCFVNTETEESEFEYWRQQPRKPPANVKKKRRYNQVLGSDGRSESFKSTTDLTTSLTPSPPSSEEEDEVVSSFSAENIAMSLLRNSKMKNVQMSDASELQWMVSEAQAPQNLLPLPKNFNSASESESDYSCGALDNSMRLRGTSDWAPPRPQIIFTIHPPANLHNLLEFQKYRCAGCGMKVEPRYGSTFRYCNYLGRYFCTGCHTLKKARLPQMIIHKWDFSPYLVSNFSATLLESLQSDPVYNIMAINPNLMKKVRLNNFRNYRIQFGYLIEYLRNCKAASLLCDELEKFPGYYAVDVDLYSLQDMIELRFSTGLPLKTKEFVTKGVTHVLNCELCKQLGFLCEVCKKNEVIFPFQLNRVARCSKCMSCFHSRCFNPGLNHCPKCLRVSVRSQNISGVAIA